MKRRKLRTVKQTVENIKLLDNETAITKYMIQALIREHKIFSKQVGNKILIDFDEVLNIFGLVYED